MNLSAERWRHIEALFHAAVELPAEEREAFIQREAAGDAEIAEELRGMLAHDATAAGQIAGAL